MSDDIQERIADQVKKNKIMVYMKGTPDFPQCGFSAQVANIFKTVGTPFGYVDVITDHEFRDGIKQFTNWPTIPQIFIDGEFIGGCDIATEMYESGELEKLAKENQAES